MRLLWTFNSYHILCILENFVFIRIRKISWVANPLLFIKDYNYFKKANGTLSFGFTRTDRLIVHVHVVLLLTVIYVFFYLTVHLWKVEGTMEEMLSGIMNNIIIFFNRQKYGVSLQPCWKKAGEILQHAQMLD